MGFGVAETWLKLKIWPAINADFVPDPCYSLENYELEYLELLNRRPNSGEGGGRNLESRGTATTKSAREEYFGELGGYNDDSQSRQVLIDDNDVF